MGAGSSQTVESVMRRFRAMPVDNGLTAVEAADRFRTACQAFRNKEIESQFSQRLLGLSLDELRAVVGSAQPGSIAFDLYTKSMNWEFGTHLIVAGVDEDGAHIHLVDDRIDTSGGELGFHAIGSGATLAEVSLARRSQQKSTSLGEAIYNVYEAKKTAELARGVGITTDMGVIRKGQPKLEIGKATMTALEAAFDRLKPHAISADEIVAIAASLAGI